MGEEEEAGTSPDSAGAAEPARRQDAPALPCFTSDWGDGLPAHLLEDVMTVLSKQCAAGADYAVSW